MSVAEGATFHILSAQAHMVPCILNTHCMGALQTTVLRKLYIAQQRLCIAQHKA